MNIQIFACMLCVMSPSIGALAAQVEGLMPIIRFGEAGSQALISGAGTTTTLVDTPPVDWGGKGLKVHFESAQRPELKIGINERVSDWSSMQELIIPLINLSRNAVNLVIRIDSIASGSAPGSRSGITRLQPQEEVALVLPLQDELSVSMGCGRDHRLIHPLSADQFELLAERKGKLIGAILPQSILFYHFSALTVP